MTASCFAISLSSSSSSISRHRINISSSATPRKQLSFISHLSLPFQSPNFSFSSLSRTYGAENQKIRVFSSDLTVMNGEAALEEAKEDITEGDEGVSGRESGIKPRPSELYICNLPRNYGNPQLLEIFQQFGTVLSVEVSRNPQTGESRGSAYLTMSSINSAKIAIAKLDGTDVEGREMRVRFSAEMNPKSGRNPELLNSTPKKILIYESPYKLYVGNLFWSTKPAEIRNHFSRFGTVVSARVLHDRKGGKGRVFAFLSFSSRKERDAAISLDGTEFEGRRIVVREGVERSDSSE